MLSLYLHIAYLSEKYYHSQTANLSYILKGRVAIDRFLPNRPFTATTRDRLTSKTVPATPDQVLARRRKVVPERLPGGTTVTGARSEADRMENEDGDERLEGRGRRRSSSPSNFFTIADALAGTTEDDDARAEADEEEELLDMPDIQDLPTSGTEHRSKRPPKRLFKKPPQDPSSSFPAAFFSPACLPDATLLPASDMLQAIHAYASDYYARATRARGRAGDWYSMDETALLALGVLLEEACLLSLGDTGDLALVEGGESDVLDVDMNLEGGITRNEDEDEDEDKEQHE
ncbi:MAG: hypothetical protein M1815_003384 [Lichina confinis]|nr:MAG: hypothetical protein M1815_003384 [Lichina confinis]